MLDENYFKVLCDVEQLEMKLDQANRFNDMLRSDIKRITASNLNMVKTIGELNELLIELDPYLPNEDGDPVSKPGTIRNFLAVEEGKRDMFQVQMLVTKAKLKIDQQKLQTLNGKVKELPGIRDKRRQELTDLQENRKELEKLLRQAHDERSEIMAEHTFRRTEKQALADRIREHRHAIAKIQKETAKLVMVLRRQMLIREFNEKKSNLKHYNLPRVAQLVDSMLGINGQIEQCKPGSSSSNENSSTPESE